MYTKAIVAALAITATAAPVAAPEPQLLNDLSPDVSALLAGLGLGNLAGPVGGVVNDLGDGLKKRQDAPVPELLANLLGQEGAVPQLLAGLLGSGTAVAKRQLLADLSPDVAALVSGLGLPNVGVPVGGVVNDLSDGLKKRQLLADLSPDVAALVSGLGLPNVGVPVGGVVNDLSDGLKKRQDAPVPELLSNLLGQEGAVPELLNGLLGSGSAVQKRQLLADLSPDVTNLLAGLGLANLGVPVGGILNSASNDV